MEGLDKAGAKLHRRTEEQICNKRPFPSKAIGQYAKDDLQRQGSSVQKYSPDQDHRVKVRKMTLEAGVPTTRKLGGDIQIECEKYLQRQPIGLEGSTLWP